MPFLPGSFTLTSFSSMDLCEAALREAKAHWQTVNVASKCIDLKKNIKIFEAQRKLTEAMEGK